MRSLLTTGLAAGAIGVSGGLDYKPAYFATTDEVVRVLEAARRWRTFFPNHDRTIPELGFSSYAGMDETRVIGQRAGLVPEFTHMKIQGHEHGTAGRVLGLMDREAAAGRWITADVYPYLAGQTGLASLIIPGWAQAGGVDSMRARFRDPELRRRIIKEADEAMNARFTGPENILVAPNRRLSEIIAANGSATPGEAVVQTLEKEMPSAILGFGVESDLVEILKHPAVAVACDCGAATGSRGHPRYFGTFPRVLGRYVREQHALTWEAAIRKMTGLPAAMMGLPDRGLLAPGMAADIVVFDSATVIDHATFEAPALPSEGIRHVLVNGLVALRDGAATGTQGGRILRGARYLPSRPLDPGATRVEAKGTVQDGPLAGARVTVALTQSTRRPGALGAVVVTGDAQGARLEGGNFGVVQRAGRWATVTGRILMRPERTDRAFTLVLDGADPGLPPNFHLMVEGLPPLAGSLAGDFVIR
ncbi:MAG: amidohydrolase family protein [Gemmatimonadales bacterium]